MHISISNWLNQDEALRLLERLRKILQTYHTSSCFYHCWPHALDFAEAFTRLAHRLQEEQGIHIDEFIGIMIGITHDMGFMLSPAWVMIPDGGSFRPARSREEVAMYLAQKVMLEVGVPEPIIEIVLEGIAATHVEAKLDTLIAQMARAADLASLGGKPEVSYQHWDNIRAEVGMMTGNDVDPKLFTINTLNLLRAFMLHRIKFTNQFYNQYGASQWHTQAVSNTVSKAELELGKTLLHVVEIGCGHTPASLHRPSLQNSDIIYIGMDESRLHRLQAHQALSSFSTSNPDPKPMSLIIPLEPGISIENGWADRLVLNQPFTMELAGLKLEALKRVCRPGAELQLLQTEGSYSKAEIRTLCQRLEAVGLVVTHEQRLHLGTRIELVA